MGYKLGKSRGNYAVNGVIKTKLRFGQEAGDTGFPWEVDANNGGNGNI